MAFDPKPSTWIPGWTLSGSNITINTLTTAFPEMTTAEANATTGDIRKVMYAICDALYTNWNTTATLDRPTKMTISRTSSVNEVTNAITKRYTFTFVTAPTGADVVSE